MILQNKLETLTRYYSTRIDDFVNYAILKFLKETDFWKSHGKTDDNSLLQDLKNPAIYWVKQNLNKKEKKSLVLHRNPTPNPSLSMQ